MKMQKASGKIDPRTYLCMEKIFHFDSPPEPYIADAAVLCCFDQRIRLAVNKFLQRREILRPDMIVVAGGAKTLASPRNDFERDFILEQVRMSIRLHQTKQMLLMSHSDCATYGGLAAFGGDREREATHHGRELQHAADLVKTSFPDLDVKCFFVTFDGVHAALVGKEEEVA
jgi:carbonic anhydrase